MVNINWAQSFFLRSTLVWRIFYVTVRMSTILQLLTNEQKSLKCKWLSCRKGVSFTLLNWAESEPHTPSRQNFYLKISIIIIINYFDFMKVRWVDFCSLQQVHISFELFLTRLCISNGKSGTYLTQSTRCVSASLPKAYNDSIIIIIIISSSALNSKGQVIKNIVWTILILFVIQANACNPSRSKSIKSMSLPFSAHFSLSIRHLLKLSK